MRALLLVLPLLACSTPPAGACATDCGSGRTCCASACVNANNDPKNCGACGTSCTSAQYCEGGTCQTPPCSADGGSCAGGALCCGSNCCATGQLCCSAEGPVGGVPPSCFTPTATATTCPQGCAPQCISDRAAKSAPTPVDAREVLERVSALPISTWSYTTDPTATRHIGPMAQDFHDAFSFGFTDKSYDPIDAHGVALASIKALAQMLEEQNARIDRLEAENRALRQNSCR